MLKLIFLRASGSEAYLIYPLVNDDLRLNFGMLVIMVSTFLMPLRLTPVLYLPFASKCNEYLPFNFTGFTPKALFHFSRSISVLTFAKIFGALTPLTLSTELK